MTGYWQLFLVNVGDLIGLDCFLSKNDGSPDDSGNRGLYRLAYQKLDVAFRTPRTPLLMAFAGLSNSGFALSSDKSVIAF